MSTASPFEIHSPRTAQVRFLWLAVLALAILSLGRAAEARVHRAGGAAPAVEDLELGGETSVGSGPPILLRNGNLRILFRGISTDGAFDHYVARVWRLGRRPVVLRFESSAIGCCSIAVRRLDRGGARYVEISGMTGGPHCCFEEYLVAPDTRRPRALFLGAFDAQPASVNETRDIDGDGRIDFVRSDDHFSQRFTWGMTSAIPPQVWNVIDGRLADVSSARRFRPLFQRYMADARPTCLQGDHDSRNSACAAYVAAAARSGAFVPAWRLMLGAYHRDDILEGRSFPQRLRALLVARRYIRRDQPTPPAVIRRG
jgi:hypothetical protein